MNLDAADRHLLAVAAVLVAAVALLVPFAAVLLGLAWRLMLWAAGAG